MGTHESRNQPGIQTRIRNVAHLPKIVTPVIAKVLKACEESADKVTDEVWVLVAKNKKRQCKNRFQKTIQELIKTIG